MTENQATEQKAPRRIEVVKDDKGYHLNIPKLELKNTPTILLIDGREEKLHLLIDESAGTGYFRRMHMSTLRRISDDKLVREHYKITQKRENEEIILKKVGDAEIWSGDLLYESYNNFMDTHYSDLTKAERKVEEVEK